MNHLVRFNFGILQSKNKITLWKRSIRGSLENKTKNQYILGQFIQRSHDRRKEKGSVQNVARLKKKNNQKVPVNFNLKLKKIDLCLWRRLLATLRKGGNSMTLNTAGQLGWQRSCRWAELLKGWHGYLMLLSFESLNIIYIFSSEILQMVVNFRKFY